MLIPHCLKLLANVCGETTKNATMGVHLLGQDGHCWAAATNGRILLAAAWAARADKTSDGFQAIIPSFFWKRAFFIAHQWGLHVRVSQMDTRIELGIVRGGSDRVSFIFKPIEGKFPPYQEVLALYKTKVYATLADGKVTVHVVIMPLSS